MKKTVIYILLSFYILAQLKPAAAILNDLLAHTFFRVQHMATIHYENGKYHLHAELESLNKEQQGNERGNLPLNEKTIKDSPQHTSTQMVFVPVLLPESQIHRVYISQILTGFTFPPAQPPKNLA